MGRLGLMMVLGAAMSTAAMAGPRVPPVDDVLAECAFSRAEDMCKSNQAEMRSDWPSAYKGDYQAQRNVAFCLIDGCDGAVRVNKALGCAWRLIILASGSTKVDDGDISNFQWVCVGKLSQAEAIVFQSSAATIYEQIYGRALDLPE